MQSVSRLEKFTRLIVIVRKRRLGAKMTFPTLHINYISNGYVTINLPFFASFPTIDSCLGGLRDDVLIHVSGSSPIPIFQLYPYKNTAEKHSEKPLK